MQEVVNAIIPKKPKPADEPEVIKVFLYTKNAFKIFPLNLGLTCENICILCCRSLNILPTARLLFGLRVFDSEEWLFPCQKPEKNVEYQFRMRFKVPELGSLYSIDPNAYEYLYSQIRYDIVHDRVDEIRYPKKKDNVVGLGAVDMYIDFAEDKGSVASIKKNYKQYLPRKFFKKHLIFGKYAILKGFDSIRRTNKNLKYVKSSYMHTFADLAPNYMREYFNATVQSLPDGEDQKDNSESYRVTVDLDLYGDEGPSIKVSPFKKQWLLVTKLENLNALYLVNDQHGVDLDINGHIKKYIFEFNEPYESKSFMTYVSGYLRLMIKWMFDPCVEFPTPSILELKRIQCHGPIGGDYSYAQIRESGKGRGTFIVRQCELEYDTYYIDIVTKRKQPETFKITGGPNAWFLHMNGTRCFDNLLELANAIPTDSKSRYQIVAGDYDKPQLLLICVPRNQLPKTIEHEITQKKLQENRTQIFDPKRDIQMYYHSLFQSDCGKMTCGLANWIQPSGFKNVKVTMKTLNKNSDFAAFMELTNIWSGIYSADFLKMYGLTLTSPYSVIVEYPKYGPLNNFLYSKHKVPFQCLLDVANGLVRAVAFMQEKGIYHGQIRCSSLMVTDYCPEKNILVAKLADPGIRREYNAKKDLPWIPSNLYDSLTKRAKFDLFSELWAFATTMWEIFALGEPIQHYSKEDLTQNYRIFGAILEIPDDWPPDIRDIIMNGWDVDGVRFDKMNILKKLRNVRTETQLIQPHTGNEDNVSLTSSNATENTCESAVPNEVYHEWLGTWLHKTAVVLKIPDGELIIKTKIGEGNYGRVHRGEIHYNNEEIVDVAIKFLKNDETTINKNRIGADFKREIAIMQRLNHPNIVKIIMSTDRSPKLIVMEYLNGRSLDGYVSSKPNLTDKQLLEFSLQIAKGMEYLAKSNIIHRDLAARNILIDGETVKICDFGLAQLADTQGYYTTQHKDRQLPIRWYAIESLVSENFSSKSDVWSYGVTLFEIFSRGEDPFLEGIEGKKFTVADFIKKLKDGERLKKPKLCPESVYEKIMLRSWIEEKKNRPTFTEIINIIYSIRNENGDPI